MLRGPKLYVVLDECEPHLPRFVEVEDEEGRGVSGIGRSPHPVHPGLPRLGPLIALDGASCLAKVADAEPIFVLRAQDITAARVVRWWADVVEIEYASHHDGLVPDGVAAKVAEARALADRMEEWSNRKLPD
jgi:hypothetical protein